MNSPSPWKVDTTDNSVAIVDARGGVVFERGFAPEDRMNGLVEDAALICRAVNTHDELVAISRAAMNFLNERTELNARRLLARLVLSEVESVRNVSVNLS